MDKSSQNKHDTLVEQIFWLIRLRWIAVFGIIVIVLIGSYIFQVLTSPFAILTCSVILLICNILYYIVAKTILKRRKATDLFLGMIQIEIDLVILTIILHFSGGVINPFFLFYIFHVIIAAIVLPRNFSISVGLTAILLFGLLELNELLEGALLGYHPLAMSTSNDMLQNPIYTFGLFMAFSCTVIIAQFLTRMITKRMAIKEIEATRNSDVLQAVINAMSEGLIFINNDGNVVICNPAAKLWKTKHEGAESDHSIRDFPKSLKKVINSLVSSNDYSSGKKNKIEFETSGTEKRYVEAKSCPVISIDKKKLGYVIVGQDLTEHKKLETDLRERTEEVTAINKILKMSRIEMAQREKMVAIGQLATGIAHEIGNPLASISSVAQYLERKFNINEYKEHLLVIQYHINRISRILKRMLSLSHPSTCEYRLTDINSLINDTLSLINFDKRAQTITIKNIANDDLPTLWLNPQHFEQVFLNIFINALDAMNAKQGRKKHILKITKELREEIIEIRISDTGIGMSSDICRRAFESFFTTKEIGKGTGLGLFISYNLVAEVDGTIALESELDKGTTVIIRIPTKPKECLISRGHSGDGFIRRAKAV